MTSGSSMLAITLMRPPQRALLNLDPEHALEAACPVHANVLKPRPPLHEIWVTRRSISADAVTRREGGRQGLALRLD